MPHKDLVTGLYVPNYESPFYKDYIIKPGQRSQKRTKTRTRTRKHSISAAVDNTEKTGENI